MISWCWSIRSWSHIFRMWMMLWTVIQLLYTKESWMSVCLSVCLCFSITPQRKGKDPQTHWLSRRSAGINANASRILCQCDTTGESFSVFSDRLLIYKAILVSVHRSWTSNEPKLVLRQADQTSSSSCCCKPSSITALWSIANYQL